MTGDLANTYLYDAEGQLCAVQTGPGSFVGYLYDAEGRRVAKGNLASLTCDPAQLQVTSTYFIGPDGSTMTEMDGQRHWIRTDVSAAGQFLATYTPSGIHYPITDWLGTKRLVVNPNLTFNNGVEETCTSWPFGDQLNCSTSLDPSPKHFTGKERDFESGLDYFEARYYGSGLGRFLSPDWSAKAEPVPYAKTDNPQSLNLYAYVGNEPVSRVDMDGHSWLERYLEQNSASFELEAFTQNQQNQQAQKDSQQNQQQAQQQTTATAKGSSVTYTYPDGSTVVLTGDHPFRDNNPGDLQSGHGSIGRDGKGKHRFAIYASLADGFNALGETLTGKYANSSISDTMKKYAPGSDGNDPVGYAKKLAASVGVPVSTKISALTPGQLTMVEYNIAVAEGYNNGRHDMAYTAPKE